MNKQEFKNTIEYSTHKSQTKILIHRIILIQVLNDIMGLVASLFFYSSSVSIAIIVLVSIAH